MENEFKETESKKNKKYILLIVLIALLVIALGVGGYLYYKAKEENEQKEQQREYQEFINSIKEKSDAEYAGEEQEELVEEENNVNESEETTSSQNTSNDNKVFANNKDGSVYTKAYSKNGAMYIEMYFGNKNTVKVTSVNPREVSKVVILNDPSDKGAGMETFFILNNGTVKLHDGPRNSDSGKVTTVFNDYKVQDIKTVKCSNNSCTSSLYTILLTDGTTKTVSMKN